jgi:hypothetical protein
VALEKIIEQITHVAQTAAQKLRVRSALNPLLWLCLIICPIFLYGAHSFEDLIIQRILIAVAVLPVIVVCSISVYFAIRKPDKLQSEEYQIKHEALQMFQVKVSSIDVPPTSLDSIASGIMKDLEDKRDTK